jgi:hypothetical protein
MEGGDGEDEISREGVGGGVDMVESKGRGGGGYGRE